MKRFALKHRCEGLLFSIARSRETLTNTNKTTAVKLFWLKQGKHFFITVGVRRRLVEGVKKFLEDLPPIFFEMNENRRIQTLRQQKRFSHFEFVFLWKNIDEYEKDSEIDLGVGITSMLKPNKGQRTNNKNIFA